MILLLSSSSGVYSLGRLLNKKIWYSSKDRSQNGFTTSVFGSKRLFLLLIMKKHNFFDYDSFKSTPFFRLFTLPSCYPQVCFWTVQLANHIQSCSLNQPIATLVSISNNLRLICQFSLFFITRLVFFSWKL